MRKRKAPSNRQLAKKIHKLQANEELKYFDTYSSTTPDTTGSSTLLNGMAQGLTAITRVGNEIKCTSLQFRGNLLANPDAVLGPTQVRIMIVWDRQANGAAPTVLGVDNGILNNATVTNTMLSPYAYENQDRYRILYDKRFLMNPQQWFDYNLVAAKTTLESVIGYQINFKKKIKLSRSVKFDNAAAGITSISANSLYYVVFSDQASNTPTVQLGFRLYYKDD